jgi:outer membrane lipoprotein-sorting protein
MITPRLWRLALLVTAAAVVLHPADPGAAASMEHDLLVRSAKAYAALKSYADTGTVVNEWGTEQVNHHTFKTYFRAPRHLYFEFNEDKKEGGNRYVLWGEGEDFQDWSSDSQTHNAYPKGRGRNAFVSAGHPTSNVVSVVPSQLFPDAGLVSVMTELAEITAAGTESLNGRSTHKLTGIARSMYGTGHVFNVRPVALWIDSETLMIRKIFQDTPKGYGQPGTRLRFTFTFQPQVNPQLEDARFRFVPPARPQ